MSNHNKITIRIILLISILNLSCSIEPNQVKLENETRNMSDIPKARKINSHNIPHIMSFIENKSNESLEFALHNHYNSRNHEEDLMISSVLTDEINQIVNNEGKSSYTFDLLKQEDEEGLYFMNLIVKEYADELYLFILKYVPDLNWLKSYKTSHDFASFSGMIYYYDSEGRYIGKGTMENGSSINVEQRNPCLEESNSNISGSGGASTDGSMPIGENSSGGGLYTIVVTVYHTIPSGETFEFGPEATRCATSS